MHNRRMLNDLRRSLIAQNFGELFSFSVIKIWVLCGVGLVDPCGSLICFMAVLNIFQSFHFNILVP